METSHFKQRLYKGKPTARIRLWALWGNGDTRDNKELAKHLGVSRNTVQTYRQEWSATQGRGVKPRRQIVKLTEDDIPLGTTKGIVWTVPKEKRLECSTCELFELCEEAVKRGWFLGCEAVYAEELIPGGKVWNRTS